MNIPTTRRWRIALLVALVLELVVIAWLVLNPSPAVPSAAVYDVSALLVTLGIPELLANTNLVEFALNVALFVPPGVTLALLLPKVPWWMWALVGLAASSTIEALQLFLLDDRSATLRDIWANTLGLGIGGLLVAAIRPLRDRPSSQDESPVANV